MERARPRELGVLIGTIPTGTRNAITDVDGVRVGQATVIRDPNPDGRGAVRTGVTAIFPHEELPWTERVYAGTHILNGYGEIIGINQITEWGLLHSPIVLTSSLAIGRAYDATVRWRTERHRTTTSAGGDMPVVTECDDSFLNDVTTFPLPMRMCTRRSTVRAEAKSRSGASAPGPACSAWTSRVGSGRRRVSFRPGSWSRRSC